jgi:tetratricopeptide (TPR) repeat protein
VCPACLNPLAQAVALYRGDFLAGFTLRDTPAFDDWQLFQAETLRRELAGALERLVRGHSVRKEFEPAIGYARHSLALDPFHEVAHCSLMSLYAQMGQRQAALRQYAECARFLERELGVSPQPETTQLFEAIRDNRFAAATRQIVPAALVREEPPARGIMSQPSRELAPVEQSVSLLDRIVRGTLIGRERQVRQMRALLQRASDGEGHVLLVSGEAGVGKTRLLGELVALAKTSHFSVLTGGSNAEGSVPYTPIAQLIRAALDTAHDADRSMPNFILADLLTLAPQLRLRYPQIAPNPPLDPHYERARLFDSFVVWCATLASQEPLLLVVDDVHWADSGTVSLLRFLAQHVRRIPLLLVMTFRDTDVELAEARALKELVLDLNRERLAESIQLMRLNREQTHDLLATMLATGGEISAEFLDSVYRETEGNPFFIEEVCKALIEAGKLFFAGGAWRRSDVHTIVVPQSVRAAILSRVEKLPSVVQETLLLAAILGREFDFPILQAMGEWVFLII